MRILLILINAMLVCGIGYGAYTWMSEDEEDLSKYDVPKNKDKVESSVNLNASMQQFSMYSGENTERMVSILGNAICIFDPERQPKNAQTTRTVTNNQRVDLTLVGTFSFGDVCGAIILQRGNQRNNNMFGMDMFGMGGMGGMAGMAGNNRNNNQNQAALAQAQREALEQQIDEMTSQVTSLRQLVQQNEGNEQLVSTLNQRIERIQGQVKTLQDSTVKTGSTSRDGAADLTEITAERTAGTKQFIRVGETMSNGYTLSAVNRTTVTLTRPVNNNVETVELTIQEASAGAAARGGNNQWNMGGRNAGGWDMMGGMGGGGRTTQVGGTIVGGNTGGGMGGGGGMAANFTTNNRGGGGGGNMGGGGNARGGNAGGGAANMRGGNAGGGGNARGGGMGGGRGR